MLNNHDQYLKLKNIQLLEILLPVKWMKEVIIFGTKTNMDRSDVVYLGFLQLIGIWLQISTTAVFNQIYIWSKPKSGFRDTPYKLNDVMSKYRFEYIVEKLAFTCKAPRMYRESFG